MSHEHDSRKASTNLTAAEHLALEIERRASAVPRPSSSVLPPEVRESLESEGYPSWLPRRPHPPGPASPSHTDGDGRVAGDIRTSAEDSSTGSPEQFATMQTNSSGWQAPKHGRNPTPRSVRILAVPDDHNDPAGLVARSSGLGLVPSVGQDLTVPPTVSRGPGSGLPRPEDHPRPRFRANGFHPKILRSPSRLRRAHFFLQPLLVFGHIPIQAFFDFNAAYILLQAARHPTPETPGIPVSGRNWALAYAAYLACYFVYFFSVFIGYELVYSFYRRWRAKHPLILPIYLSARAFELVCMTSYTNFCFLLHLRTSAFRRSQNGSLRDGFAETCFRYSQNLPTVILLLPRAALCLSALLSFSAATPAVIQATAGPNPRDRTFFNANGSLTSYARGILIANAAWTMWRVFVLLASWLGLWILSGEGCAGLCGPRYRWEEDDDEKSRSAYSHSREDAIIDRWAWLPYTIARVQDTYDFCLTPRTKRRSLTGSTRNRSLPAMTEAPSASLPTSGSGTVHPSATPSAEALRSRAAQGALSVDGVTPDPSVPIAGSSLPSTKRNVVESDLYAGPSSSAAVSSLVPPTPSPLQSLAPVYDSAKAGQSANTRSGPVLTLPFPFYPASVPPAVPNLPLPFPLQSTAGTAGPASASSSPLVSFDGDEEYVIRDSDTDDMRAVQLPTSAGHPDDSQEPRVSLERASGSLSSLGQPMSSQYPFEYRRSGHGSRTPSSGSRRSPHLQSSSSQANSLAWSSSPRSRSSPRESFRIEGTSSHVSPIEPPPRHPSAGGSAGRRRRAGTAPSLSSSPLSSEDSARGRTVSVTDQTFGVQNPLPPVQGTHDEDDDFEADFEFESGEDLALGSQEEAEKDDSIGLLSSAPSPKSSIAALRRRASSLVSGQRRASSGSFRAASGHPSPTPSSSSIRSRAASLVPVIGQTSSLSSPTAPQRPAVESSPHSSRSRTSSVVKANTESVSRYSDAQSHVSPTPGEDDHTFGLHPPSINWDDVPRGSAPEASRPSGTTPALQIPRGRRGVLRPSASRVTSTSQQTVSQGPIHADISEAPSSYVTAAPTFLETTTEGSGGTIRTVNPWGDPSHDVM